MKVLVGAFNQEKALVGSFSVTVKSMELKVCIAGIESNFFPSIQLEVERMKVRIFIVHCHGKMKGLRIATDCRPSPRTLASIDTAYRACLHSRSAGRRPRDIRGEP